MKWLLSLIIIYLFPALAIHAQPVVYDRITIEQGLSQGMIFDLLQTRDGFLWVATKDGLNRYDGYNFQIFRNNPFDAFSLTDNETLYLFEDSRGWLWIGLQNKGVDLYVPQSGRFYHFPFQFQGINGFSFIRQIVEDQDGSIWLIQGRDALVHVQIPASWKERLPDKSELINEVIAKQIRIETYDEQEILIRMEPGPDGLSLFSTEKQYRIDRQSGVARPVSNPLLPSYIGSIAVERNKKEVWAAGNFDELFCVGEDGLKRYQSPIPWLRYHHFIEYDHLCRYWLVHGNKLWELRADHTFDFSRPDWETDRDINCMETDRNGNIWLGTFGYGLRKINPGRQLFHPEVSGQSTWRVWQSPTGARFWRDISSIYSFEAKKTLKGLEVAFPELGGERNMDLLFDSDGSFWMLGVPEKDIYQGILRHYTVDKKLLQTFSFAINMYDYMQQIRGRDGNIWITGGSGQLLRFHPDNGKIEYFSYAHLFGKKVSTAQALALTEDGNGDLWIGTKLGLVKARWNAGRPDFQLLEVNPGNPKGLNNNVIACLLPDPAQPAHWLWIGTKGGGINRLDLQTGHCEHLTMADGLPDQVIYGILPGNEKASDQPVSLWCSTNRGLVRLVPRATNPLSAEIITYTAAKGLQDNEFNTQAFFKATNGELLFGGVNGVNRFSPETLHADTTRMPVYLVGLEINHRPALFGQAGSPLTEPLEYLRLLTLPYDENNVSFEFAALDFTDPSQNRYRYLLEGLDAEWVNTGNIRFAHFTHLAPGRYKFRVQGTNGQGKWQEMPHPVVLVIRPPWYRSQLAYLLYVLALIWSGWRLYQFQIRRVKEREQLAFEQRETERVKALEQMKTNFFSNITHEFRTPLTLILEPARRILAETAEPNTRQNAQHVETNSRRLLGLVNQLLDMAKLENGSMGLDLRLGDLPELVRSIFQSFQPLAEQRSVQFSLELPDTIPPALFDQNKAELVISNLISNALKFTPVGGKVTVYCNNTSTSEQSSAAISVTDTGIGIPPESLGKIFDRFYQVDATHTRPGEGTGIGLALTKELVELMHGNISVQSEPDKGTIFTFCLPLQPGAVEPADPARKNITKLDALTTFHQATDISEDRPTVLLVEDNAELRSFIKTCIGPNWQIEEASDGQEGVEKALEIVPDLVISDVMMPRKDGYAVCDDLKNNELTSHIPIILLTAKSTVDARIKGWQTGADDYLSKPFNSDELLARMENLLESRRRLRERYSQSMQQDGEPEASDILSARDREFLNRFIQTVEQHLSDETISVEDLARKMFVSRTQLHRKLKALTDQNVTDFVRAYRLDRAMTMLRNREGLVYEVAYRVGFGSEKYFSKAFKDKFGVPPSGVN
ncbi:MAG: response regulator [Saprospiraceae bacterium]|nr:response regulator [Saprospiraceae bacterium]